jgi:hypothetical protein
VQPAAIDPTILKQIYREVVRRSRSGQPITVVHDASADQRTKKALMPGSPVHKSIVCKHLNRLIEAGRISATAVSEVETIHGDRWVPTPVVEIVPVRRYVRQRELVTTTASS